MFGYCFTTLVTQISSNKLPVGQCNKAYAEANLTSECAPQVKMRVQMGGAEGDEPRVCLEDEYAQKLCMRIWLWRQNDASRASTM